MLPSGVKLVAYDMLSAASSSQVGSVQVDEARTLGDEPRGHDTSGALIRHPGSALEDARPRSPMLPEVDAAPGRSRILGVGLLLQLEETLDDSSGRAQLVGMDCRLGTLAS